MLTGLPPIVHDDSRLLILGSMPSAASLQNQRYYDFKQNRFWYILFDFFGAPFSADYAQKKELLRRGRIALWDAIGQCERENSSLDSKIKNVTPNDISNFLARHPSIRHVVVNGRTAEKYFCAHNPNAEYTYLPSTSPANASVKDVAAQWHAALRRLLAE